MQSDNAMKREHGFTLLELMTTLAIGGILLSMAVPALQSFTNNAKRSSAVNDFVSSMHLARNTAITTNARVTICPSAGGVNCEAVDWEDGFIVFADPDSDQNVDAGEVILSVSAALEGISATSAEFPNFLMYRPNGRAMTAAAAGNSGQLTFCDIRGADHARVVIIELSGRPKLSEYQADGSAPAC